MSDPDKSLRAQLAAADDIHHRTCPAIHPGQHCTCGIPDQIRRDAHAKQLLLDMARQDVQLWSRQTHPTTLTLALQLRQFLVLRIMELQFAAPRDQPPDGQRPT